MFTHYNTLALSIMAFREYRPPPTPNGLADVKKKKGSSWIC